MSIKLSPLTAAVLSQLGATPAPTRLQDLYDSEGNLCSWAKDAINASMRDGNEGYQGFISYEDGVNFCAKFWPLVWDRLQESARSQGMTVTDPTADMKMSEWGAPDTERMLLDCARVIAAYGSDHQAVFYDDAITDDHAKYLYMVACFCLRMAGDEVDEAIHNSN